MAEIIYSETEKNRKALDQTMSSQVMLDKKYTVWQDASKVGITVSVLRSGVNKPTGKRWFKWGTYMALGFRYSTRGNVVPYQVERATSLRPSDLWHNRSPVLAFSHLDGVGFTTGVVERFQRAMGETFGVSELADIYPLTRHYGLEKYSAIPGNLRPAFRQSDLRDAAVVAFGKTRVTPDWVIAMEETDPYIVAVAEQFRGYAANASVLEFMKKNVFDQEMEETFQPHTPRLRPFVKNMHPHSYEFLLSTKLDNMDLKRIYNTCAEGINIKFGVTRVGTNFPVHDWNELLKLSTGRDF